MRGPITKRNEQEGPKPKESQLTVATLAKRTGLPEEFLRSIRVADMKNGVVIRYQHEDGAPALRHRRQRAGGGFRWTGSPNDPIIPYGLWKLRKAHAEGYAIIVKSELEWWTLTYHEFPALAVPSPNMVKILDLKHLDQIDRVYVIRDGGGKSELFPRRVLRRLENIGWHGELYIVTLPENAGDVNEVHRKDSWAFRSAFQEALKTAAPFPDPTAKGDGKSPGLTKTLADAITAEAHFARDAAGRLYIFQNGVYRVGAEFWIKRRVKELLEEWQQTKYWTPGKGPSVLEYVRLGSPELWESPPIDRINLENGLLNVDTLALETHSQDFLSPIRIPIAYNPQAACPSIDQFIKEAFPEDATDLGYEILGDLLTPERSIQKSILLTGAGGNGKSVFLTMAMNFIGQENVSTVTLHKLEADRFATANLYGKLANISSDLPSEHLVGTSVFKSISGNDRITAEFKFKDAFQFTPFTRLLFSANSPPQSKDASKAFYDRWIVIPFDREFRGTEKEIPRSVLDARLSAPEERSGALNNALHGLKRLRERGRFSESQTTRTALLELQQVTDPFAIWLDRETTTGPHELVGQGTLLAAYNLACETSGRPVMTKQAFGRALKRLRPDIEEAQRTIDGIKQWVYLGIGLKGEWPNTEEQESEQERRPVAA